MGTSSHLKDSVLEQAHEKGRKLLAEAKQQIETEAAERKQRLLQERGQDRARKTKAVRTRLQRDVQQIENKKRQSTLVTKQGVLKELFAEAYDRMAAWTVAEEQAFLQQVLVSYPDEVVLTLGAVTAAKFTQTDRVALERAFPQVKISEEEIANQAGFVLSLGQVDANYLYRDLVQSIWEQEGYRMAGAIFQEDKG